METIIEAILANQFIFIAVFGALIVLAGLSFSKKIIKTKKGGRMLGIFIILIMVVLISFMVSGPYGSAIEFMSLTTNGKYVALVEGHERGDQRFGQGGETETRYRLYIMDAKTGKRLVREMLKYTDLLCVTDRGTVVYESTWATLYDNNTGEAIHTWSKNRGFEKYNELNGGVSRVEFELKSYQGKDHAYLIVTALDGHMYHLDLADEKLYPGKVISDPREAAEEHFSFKTQEGKIKRLTKQVSGGVPRTSETTFLDPTILVQNDAQQYLIIQHFATLKKNDVIFTAVSYDMQTRWELTQQQVGDLASNYVDVVKCNDDRIFATFGGTVVCLNADTGAVLWTEKL